MGPLITGPVTGPTAAALAGGRERFNALFAAARRGDRSLDGERFAAHLAERLPAVVGAAEHAAPGSAAVVTEALYEASLDLLVHGLLGTERGAALGDLWGHALPAAARQLADDPRRVAAALCNGLLQVASTPGARPAQWTTLMVGVAPLAPDVPTLLDAGLVAAWRAGMAHAREAALARLGELPPEVAAAALGEAAIGTGDVQRMASDRWWTPGRAAAVSLQVMGRVGSFRGFGGAFLTPPRLAGERSGTFLVEGGTGPYLLYADTFGATLGRAPDDAEQPAGGDAEPAAPAAFTLADDGSVTSRAGSATFPGLAGATSWTSSYDTLAVTTPNSHAVTLVALVQR